MSLKKPVNFGYLDFSTPEKRRWAIERELVFNRSIAPGVYREIREVEGEAVLVMHRFDETALLSAHPEQVDGALTLDPFKSSSLNGHPPHVKGPR